MNRRTEQQPDRSRAAWLPPAYQFMGLPLLMLLSLELLSGVDCACEAAARELPSGDAVKQNDTQQAAPEAISIQLPRTTTLPAAEYFSQLKKVSTQQVSRDSPAIDTQSLIELLDSKDQKQRIHALKSLANAGPQATDALPKLLEILRQEDSYDKTLALRCVAAIGPTASDAVPQLHALLKDKDKPLVFRMEALRALGRIGPASEVVIPTLLGLLKNPGELEKSYPKASGSPSAMGLMAPMLHKGDDGRWYFDRRDENIALAIGGLGAFGAAAAHAIPDLQKVRNNPDMLPTIRESAKKVIDHIHAEVAKEQEALERPPPAM